MIKDIPIPITIRLTTSWIQHFNGNFWKYGVCDP